MCYHVYTMNETVGIRELRQQASALMKRVVNGEVINVSDRGRPIARIVPLREGTLEQLVLEGRATGGGGDLLALAKELGLPEPASEGMNLSQALAELRSDER